MGGISGAGGDPPPPPHHKWCRVVKRSPGPPTALARRPVFKPGREPYNQCTSTSSTITASDSHRQRAGGEGGLSKIRPGPASTRCIRPLHLRHAVSHTRGLHTRTTPPQAGAMATHGIPSLDPTLHGPPPVSEAQQTDHCAVTEHGWALSGTRKYATSQCARAHPHAHRHAATPAHSACSAGCRSGWTPPRRR